MSQALSPIALPFPARGVNDGSGLSNQVPGTAQDARNVRTFEQLEDRARGGQRPGLVKAFATDIGENPLDIGVVILPSPDTDALPGLQTSLFDMPNGDDTYPSTFGVADEDSRITCASELGESGGAANAVTSQKLRYQTASGEIYYQRASSVSATRTDCGVVNNLTGLGTVFEMAVTFQRTSGQNFLSAFGLGLENKMGMAWRVSSDYKSCLQLQIAGASGNNISHQISSEISGTTNSIIIGSSIDFTTLGINYPVTELTYTIAVAGDVMTAYLFADGMNERVEILSGTVTALSGNTGIGWGIEGSADTSYRITRVQVLGNAPAPFGRRTVYIIPQVSDAAYLGTLSDDNTRELAEITGGSGTPLGASGNVSSMSLFNKLYSVNGTTGIVIDPEAATLNDWTATAGTRPDGYLTAAFRGSAVIAADPADPNNLYMSAVEDPLDWDYGAEPIETSAFALDSSDLGKNADPIIALATWSDDYMLLGGASTLRVMTGDPRAGGRLDTVTQSLGVMGPKALCVDPQGQLYFMGNDGLYRMPFGSTAPSNLSAGRLDAYLRDVNLSTTKVHVSYDSQDALVHVFLVPIDPTGTTVHVVYSLREDAFWLDSFGSVNLDPTVSASIFGDSSDTRNVILGCRDGFIRRFDQDAKDDDGTAIASYVRYAPVLAGGGMSENIIRELQVETARGSDAMTWTLRAADSPEELADSANVRTRTGTLAAATAFQSPKRMSLRYAAVQLEIGNDTLSESWAMERALMRERLGGRRRA